MGAEIIQKCTRELSGLMVMFYIFFWVVITQVYSCQNIKLSM